MRWLNDGNKSTGNRIESILLIMIMVLYAFLGLYYIPYALLLFPVPFIVFSLKSGIIFNIINMMVTCIIVGIIDSPGDALFLFVIFVPMTAVISYLIKNRRNNMEVLGISSAVFFISLLIILSMANSAGMDFVNQLEEGFQQTLTNQLEYLKQMDLLTQDQMIKEQESLEELYNIFLLIVPSILLTISLVVSYLNYLVASLGLNKIGIKVVNTPRFSKFRLPHNIVPGVMVMFLGTFVMDNIGLAYADAVLINIIALIGLMLFFQGLSVLDFYFKRFKIMPIVRFIIYIFLLFNQFVLILATITGFIDVIFDLRKIKRIKSQ